MERGERREEKEEEKTRVRVRETNMLYAKAVMRYAYIYGIVTV